MAGDNVDIKVPITEYTKHIVKEAVTEAMRQHQDTCPLIKTVADLSYDMWGDYDKVGIKERVRSLESDYTSRSENVKMIKKPFVSGLVGAFFVGVGILFKCAWEWLAGKS